MRIKYFNTILLLLLFTHYLTANDIHNLLKFGRENQISLESDNPTKNLQKYYLENRYRQNYSDCHEINSFNIITDVDSILFHLIKGDCYLFNHTQNSTKAYSNYLEAFVKSRNVKDQVLLIESLNKLISYNLYSGNNESENLNYINIHLENCYDSLELIRNWFFKLSYGFNLNEYKNEPLEFQNSWNNLISKCQIHYPRLETEIRSKFAIFLEINSLINEAKYQYLKSIESSSKVNDEFHEGTKFSSYANMGIMVYENNEYLSSITQFRKALSSKVRMSNDRNSSLLYNYMSDAFKKVNQMDSAFKYLNLSFELNRKADSKMHDISIKEIQSKYDNEKLNLELLNEKSDRFKIQMLLFTFITISGILFFIYRNQLLKKKAVQKELENVNLKSTYEKQTALQSERNRIAAEMHDDLGGGLTSIKFLGHRVLKKVENTGEKEIIEKMVTQSSDLIDNMSEIIWAMNSGFDSIPSLTAYLRAFGHKYFGNFEMPITFDIQDPMPNVEVTSQKRRNIFLVIKEAFHNISKHAEAKQVQVAIHYKDETLYITIQDDGKGITEKQNEFGNGLYNMQKRIESINGSFEINSILQKGTQVNLKIPIGP